jgi:hypothetical protein
VTNNIHFTSAFEDFRIARRRAAVRSIIGRLRKRQDELLSYEDVRAQLHAIEGSERKLEDIPISSIVGSVNRYSDFTRDFLPKNAIDGERWARVKAASMDMVGLPPIEVYQIGEVYFVQDGNHRVSIANQEGARNIQAYVRKVHSKVSLTPEIIPDDLIIKEEYLDFIETTHLDRHRQDTDLDTTSPGGYPFLLQQIEAVKFVLEQKIGFQETTEEAAVYWHDKVYMPIVFIIREKQLLKDFPNRTETDLFIWLVRYQRELIKEVGWDISIETSAGLLGSKISSGFKGTIRNALYTLIPERYKPEYPIGEWRKQQLAAKQGRLFADIMVILSGKDNDWKFLKFSLNIAKEEGSRVHALLINRENPELSDSKIAEIKQTFGEYCDKFGVSGKLVINSSKLTAKDILNRAKFTDLVLVPNYFIKSKAGKTILDNLVHRGPTPIIAASVDASYPIKKGLLAYDGSLKAAEALFLAAYLAKFWEIQLVILTVFGNRNIPDKTLADAVEFLDRYKVNAEYIKAAGPPAIAVNLFATESGCDLIIAGGYGSKPFFRLNKGSMIDNLIKNPDQSILICK